MLQSSGCNPYTLIPSPPSLSRWFQLLGTVCVFGDLPGSMNEEKEHLELSSTICHWQGEGSLVRVTSTAPWAVQRQLSPHSPKPIQSHTAPELRVCSAASSQGMMDPGARGSQSFPTCFHNPPPPTLKDKQGIFVGRQPERLCFFDFCQGSSFYTKLKRRGRTKQVTQGRLL